MCVSSRCVYLNENLNKKKNHRYFLFRCNEVPTHEI